MSGGPTAYMLMYKHYNPALKEQPVQIPDELIPTYLKSEIEEETEKLIQMQIEREEKLLIVKLKVYYKDDFKIFAWKRTDPLEKCL